MLPKLSLLPACILLLLVSCTIQQATNRSTTERADHTHTLSTVYKMGEELLASGLSAGKDYDEVWIRDFNTFTTQICHIDGTETAKNCLLTFLGTQEDDGNIADGYKPKGQSTFYPGYHKIHPNRPNTVYHKNTVETDQESSLVQSLYKYVKTTGDQSILTQNVFGKTVIQRAEDALNYLLNHRYDPKTGLIWGATTADWGDVQPENQWAVSLDSESHRAIDIYDNAMFLIAIQNFVELLNDNAKKKQWTAIRTKLFANTKKYLWDPQLQKFIPHIYLDGSPFPSDFDESQITYHGGTAIAIEAGLLSPKEILAAYSQMKKNVSRSGAMSIGLTLYPAYPKNFFALELMAPYNYQNGGDWTWFGARMASQLARHGFIKEAWEAALPMLNRVIENNGFYEWYTVDGKAMGNGEFRGSAGVLMTLIEDLKIASKNRIELIPNPSRTKR